MSSATYLIASDSFKKAKNQICFYMGCNGHPTTAAKHFLAMHQSENQWGGYAERFLRANKTATFTDDPEAHWDTEYRYALEKDGTLIVHQASFHKVKKWGILFTGTWYDFVNEFLVLPPDNCLSNFTVLDFLGSSLHKIMSLKEAIKESEQEPGNAMLKAEIQYCLRKQLKGGNPT